MDLSHSRVQNGDLAGIEHLTHLERLYLSRTSIRVDDVAEAVKCERLKRISLWGNHNIHSGVIDELIKRPTLEAIDISQTRVIPVMIGGLGVLPRLKLLVFNPHFRSQESDRMNGDVMRQLSAIDHLQPTGECFLQSFDSEEVMMFGRSSRV